MESFVSTKTEFLINDINNIQQTPYSSLNNQIGQDLSMPCRKKLDFDSSHPDKRKLKTCKQNSLASISGTGFTKKQIITHSHLQFPRIPSNTKRNARERKRVRTINDYFGQLQKYLPYTKPAQSTSGTPGPKKLSKVETLKAAIEFIEYLQQYAPVSHKTSSTKQQQVLNVSSPSSSISGSSGNSSLQSSPTTSTVSFTSNMGLVEKLKIKCESPSKPRKLVVDPLLTAGFDTTAVPSVYGNPAATFSGQQSSTYSSDLTGPAAITTATPADSYYNYNMANYGYSDSTMGYYTCHNNEPSKAAYKTQQPDMITSSPTYSTSSSECYGNYGSGMNGGGEGMANSVPIDYNNNSSSVCGGLRYNDLPATNFQYHQYSSNTPGVQYC